MITSYELVKSLEKRKIWQEYMTKNECKILKEALKSNDTFNNFMNQKASDPINSNYLAMLHTQQMISEQLLFELYRDIPKCPIDKEPNPTIKAMKSLFKPILDDDDDNYDFDEEETKEEEKEIENKIDEEEDKENERDLILDDMYYPIDYDEEAEIEYNKKKLDKEVQEEDVEEDEDEEKPKIQMPIRNYLDLPNAKFLSAYIDSHMSSKDSYALKSLIADLKPMSKSKWYNEDRINQDVLYDHCERILNELKNYVEHSGPFLNKVNKRDAPNYYEIIKKPMDLSLMSRKLKGLQYNSKEEFSNDLELIWSNCLAYNTDPKSPFRMHAMKMRVKANSLMKSVPDVTIKIKGDSDSEDDASHLNIKENVQTSQSKTDPMVVDKISNIDSDDKTKQKKTIPNEEKELFEKGEDIKTVKWKEDSLNLRATSYVEMENEFKKPFNERKPIIRDPLEMQKYYIEEKEHIERIKNYFKSNNSIANSTIDLPSLSQNNLNDTNTDDKNNLNNIPSSSDNNNKKNKNHNKTSKSFYPEYSHFSSSIPEIPQIPYDIGTKIIPSNEFDRESIEIPTLFEYDEIRQEKNDNSLASIMCNNIIELRTIQALFYKIQAKQIGNEVPPTSVIPNLFEESERKFIPESLPPLTMNERTGRILLKKYISEIFAHTGFDMTQKEALEIAIDVLIQYIHNIGHSLKLYIDQFSKDTDFLTILEKVLEINQCNPKSLYYHMKTGIQKFSVKLVDLRKKLDYTYKDLCSQRNQSMYDEDGFMDDDDAFISGNFGEDIGIDFFGFKQMGIDISNIPTELWRKKADHPIRSRIRQARRYNYGFSQPSQPSVTTYQAAPKFKPIVDVNTQVIGLLKPYYEKKIIENDMVEDENKPSRLRSKIMRNKAALKKKRDEEDNRRHKEKEQIKKELKITENKEEKGKNKNESHESIVKKEVKIPSGTTTVNSIPKPETPLSTTDKISEKINPETPSSTDKNEQNDNKRKRYENIETDSTPKKIKIEPK
ncbi:hypothetical protein BCR36DRAFT_339426 [Piromyces finnis]|uniref:Bromo domain-containing protein n=2 Tax=Piromyces finnis TaxID=1754191 RepID=A0A1Y1UW61_9FUNG|nr:hypothetical protein BCR36DRAFT_339426 [Piromyces finnis]|eukprot:ORX41466.1 hypothetical protein BCR36DRAFT_339426 [Piromyces finnis]